MPVGSVYMSSDAYLACMAHALSTEGEEIMGLLLGEVKHEYHNSDAFGSSIGDSHIESVVILQRSDRKSDRVEISPLQLSAAAQEAEELSLKLGKPIRVMGWYHSHPHITVVPSHVDVRTQANYQAMDPDFIGLIFSVFQQETNEKFASASMICFQSEEINGNLERKEILVHINPPSITSQHCLQAIAGVSRILYDEENALKESSREVKNNGSTYADAVSNIHNSAVFTLAVCQLIECCAMPCISALSAYEESLNIKLQQLKEMKKALKHKR